MYLRALLVLAALGMAAIAPAEAKMKTPKSTNANVRRASRKAKKFKPTKYKAPKASKKPPRAKYGVKQK